MAHSTRRTGFSFERLEDRRLMAATLPVVFGPTPGKGFSIVAPVAELAPQVLGLGNELSTQLGNELGTKITTLISTSSNPSIVGFNLVNNATGQTIMNVTNGMTIDLATLPTRNVNLAPIASSNTTSVMWDVDGQYEYNITNTAPFKMSNAASFTPTVGIHQLFALGATGLNEGGARSDQEWLNFTIVDGAQQIVAPAISGFNLINNVTGATIMPVTNGMTIDLGALPTTNINLVPVANSATKSVMWDVDGQYEYNITNNAPFKMSNAASYAPTVGSHQLFALAAADLNEGGARSDQAWLNFTVVDTSSAVFSGKTGGTTAAPDAPTAVINALSTSIVAGNSVTVYGTGSTLVNGSPINATYQWDFGDPNGKYNSYQGFNAAHIYDTPGTYTITLRVTDNTGKVGGATTKVTVAADTRTAIYLSNSGNDANNGLTAATAVKSVARANALLGDNTKLLLHRGETYDLSTAAITVNSNNVVISDYGTSTLAAPVLRRAAGSSLYWLIGASASSHNVTIQNLAFDSVTPTNLDKEGAARGIEPAGQNMAVRNCTIINLTDFVNAESKPDGVLLQDNTSPSVTGLRAYFLWAQGADLVAIGNTVANSTREHVLRVGGADRVNASFNNFSNIDRTSVDSQDIAKGTFVFQKGTYFFASNNTATDGPMGTGPLGGADGTHDASASAQWVVFQNNIVHNTLIQIIPGISHVAFHDNVVYENGSYGFLINPQDPTLDSSGNAAYTNRNVNDINIFSNTVVDAAQYGNFLKVAGHANAKQINLYNNLFVDPAFTTGAYQSALVYVQDTDLSAFNKISNNVWATPVAYTWVAKAEFYVAPQWGLDTGYLTGAQWASMPQVSGDVYGSVALPAGSFAETINGITGGSHLTI